MSGVQHGEALAPAVRAAAVTVRVDHATAEILRAFDEAGVSSILLKGPALGQWLYGPEERRLYQDCDLLVAPSEWERAGDELSRMGYVAEAERLSTPWWNTHSIEWRQPASHVVVDLHYTLEGIGADPERLWSVFSAHTETTSVGGFPATVPAVPGRALILALHACQHGPSWPAIEAELDRALALADDTTWRAAARLAADLRATGAFATGLRLVPDGRGLADRIGLPRDVPLEIALSPGFSPSGALTMERFARARGVRRRVAMIRYALAPPPTVLRSWSRRELTGAGELAHAYVRHAAWLVRSIPAARKARRAARSQVREGQDKDEIAH